jgi:hypothetical protein
MTGPELDLLEGGVGNADLYAGLLRGGGRAVHASRCENPYGQFGRAPFMVTVAADYVSRLAVQARTLACGHSLIGKVDYQRYYTLRVSR